MEIKSRKPVLRFAPAKAGFAFAGVLPLLVAAQAHAVEFSFADNEITGSLDTTISYGQLWRVQGQDKTNNDINTNDGNRNFDTGLVSEVFKITSDLEASYQNYGVFIRGTAFYDTQIMDKRNDYYDANTPAQPSQSYPRDNTFTRETRHKAGRDAQILDAYVYGNWDVANMPVSGRFGKQVFNWGEGLYYRGGVNTTNPVDAAKFRLPGSEVKEVLVPVEALSFNIGLTDNLSMEAFYQFNWKESAIDPVGTYFSETDLFADGGSAAYNESGDLATALAPNAAFGGMSLYQASVMNPAYGLSGSSFADANAFKVASIKKDLNAKNDGQFGVAFRYIAEELNSTEFGFYFVNYHAKEPAIYAQLDGAYGGMTAAQIDALRSSAPVQGAAALAAAQAGAPGNVSAIAAAANQITRGLVAVDLADDIQASRQYAEDVRMMGLSFNTTVGNASVFGELAYRPNLPIGIATTNDLLEQVLQQAPEIAQGQQVQVGGQTVSLANRSISNYERVEAFNTSLGTIYNFGPSLGFDSLFGIAELASEHIRGSSLKYTDFRGDVLYYSGRANGSYTSGYGRDDQINKNSYGYTLVLSGTWNDVYAGVNLSPFAVFKHDFEGNSHQTGNFIEGRKAYTVGMRASYLNSLEAEIQYTEFYGAGQNNGARDRDNIGVNVKYSF
ncbi:DUF1302 domain-containing protein [Ectopseudomonas oleovorans]|uniref:Glycine betaine transmethylase n=1 Tax=Ectopseudomonas oleovorans (strain CECT 5344) TaxID=1182590 RepID=W6RHI3_ECTO5|nr:DUF1302 domain-containing protein [Pseudomonas oleovorans]PZP81589.1 MAG: DUF1302 domain-containing protein [Pseudomonas oleovorans]CDM41299.1 hypothetical protein BN5_2736 [Pseudomonas oleovorans CECT 5344]CDR91927.1 hypothetical protein PPSAL_2700 [Pseudomonas oleovorans]